MYVCRCRHKRRPRQLQLQLLWSGCRSNNHSWLLYCTSNYKMNVWLYGCMFVCMYVCMVNNIRKRSANIVTPLNQQCPTCQQCFQRLAQHTNSNMSACFNVVRLRKYICLRKQIPFEPPACLPELQYSTADQLEKYLMDLH